MKRFTCILAAVLLAVLPAIAQAHQGDPNYRSEITTIRPSVDGLLFQTYNFDDGVRLQNVTGREVVVIGYDGEPYVRISADGLVEVNLNSPSYYLNEDRKAEVKVPDRADAKAAPEWKEVDDTGQYAWHDHRSHFMGEGLPPQVKDESTETKVFDYVIPLEVDGKPVKAKGTLTWVGNDSNIPVIPFVVLAIAVIAAIAFWVIRRRRNETDGADEEDTQEGSGRESW